jgi:trk system potassium uptake protein TrkH
MLFRPDVEDLRLIGLTTGGAVGGIGALMVPFAGLAALLGEGEAALSFVVGAGFGLSVGALSQIFMRGRTAMRATHGLAALAIAWPLCAYAAALPLVLSGHWAGFGDAWFEAVSGLTASGLSLVNDLDHLPVSIDLWRHSLQLIGAFAIMVVAVTVLSGGGRALGAFHASEEPEEHIGANALRAVRLVGPVFAAWSLAGLAAVLAAVLYAGLPPLAAVRHAVSLFATAFSTGGFAVHTSNLGFYRSPVVEAVAIVLMLGGAVGMPLHVLLSRRRVGELQRGLEPRTFALSLLAVFAVLAVGLVRTETFAGPISLWRAGFLHTVSAHTTSGLHTVPRELLRNDWGELAPIMLLVAMGIGGMAASAAGGVKAIRLGLLGKGIGRDVHRVVLPENAVVSSTYQAGVRRKLEPEHVRGAAVIVFLFLVLYLGVALLGLLYGYEFDVAMFDAVAASSTSGLSLGLVRPGLEWFMELVLAAAMVVGRLEFLGVLTLFGYAVSFARGRA